MVDSQTVIIALASSLAAAITFTYLIFTRYMGQRKEENETQKARLHLELVKWMTDEKFSRAITEILWDWQWTDFDDYWSKYSPRNNPEANVTRRLARDYYVGLATLVRRGAVDIDLVYEMNPSGVTRYWEKIGPIALEFRSRNDYPDYLEPVEYLANEMEKIRERRGISRPKQVKG
ncbi:hypothetical protein JXL21_04820 [Candidatus Bathyarchaeota archaeon]|nr:hypothetical protein [Candidatus Bathyarchaeota archaeon]